MHALFFFPSPKFPCFHLRKVFWALPEGFLVPDPFHPLNPIFPGGRISPPFFCFVRSERPLPLFVHPSPKTTVLFRPSALRWSAHHSFPAPQSTTSCPHFQRIGLTADMPLRLSRPKIAETPPTVAVRLSSVSCGQP